MDNQRGQYIINCGVCYQPYDVSPTITGQFYAPIHLQHYPCVINIEPRFAHTYCVARWMAELHPGGSLCQSPLCAEWHKWVQFRGLGYFDPLVLPDGFLNNPTSPIRQAPQEQQPTEGEAAGPNPPDPHTGCCENIMKSRPCPSTK